MQINVNAPFSEAFHTILTSSTNASLAKKIFLNAAQRIVSVGALTGAVAFRQHAHLRLPHLAGSDLHRRPHSSFKLTHMQFHVCFRNSYFVCTGHICVCSLCPQALLDRVAFECFPAGIVTSLLVALLGQARIYVVLGREQLLPSWFAFIHAKQDTPMHAALFTGATAGRCFQALPQARRELGRPSDHIRSCVY